MADPAGGLIYVMDENFGGMPVLLRQSKAVANAAVRTLGDLGIPSGALDPAVLHRVGQLDRAVLLTRDGSMLGPLVQRGAWRSAGVTLFLFGGKWGGLPLGELTRRVLYLWPSIVDQANASAAGAAWRVSPTIPSAPSNAFRLVTGRHANP